jgi:transcriptional regulator with XRE-family HTH domain
VILHAEQIRAARSLLGWSQADLAQQADVAQITVRRFEANSGSVSGKIESLIRIQNALEKAGIVFLAEDQQFGVGVRLVKPQQI